MAQRGSPSKPTRFKGPIVVTLRGAGSLGNDPNKLGAGTDVGLDIQVPLTQTANAIQVTKPDGTVVFAIGSAGTGIVTAFLTPATSAATGIAGTLVCDANFIYVCVATNTWKRVAITTW